MLQSSCLSHLIYSYIFARIWLLGITWFRREFSFYSGWRSKCACSYFISCYHRLSNIYILPLFLVYWCHNDVNIWEEKTIRSINSIIISNLLFDQWTKLNFHFLPNMKFRSSSGAILWSFLHIFLSEIFFYWFLHYHGLSAFNVNCYLFSLIL